VRWWGGMSVVGILWSVVLLLELLLTVGSSPKVLAVMFARSISAVVWGLQL